MVNVRFGNYEQFKEFFRKAPRKVQDILYKAYPDFARQLREEYINATKTLGTTKEAIKSTANKAKEATKVIGTTASKATQTASKGLGLASKLKFVPGVVGGAWTMLDPRTTPNQKVLGGMMMVPQTMPYATAGLIATEAIPKAVDAFYKEKIPAEYDYQQGDILNAYGLAPELKELTPEERDKVLKYNDVILANTKRDADNTLREGSFQIATPFGSNTSGYDLTPVDIPQSGQIPTMNNRVNISKNVQDAQQGRLNIPQDNLYLNSNQPSLTSNVDVAKILGGDIPDYQTWNTGANLQLQNLIDNVNQTNQVQGVQPMQNSAGSEALLQYLQMQNARQAQQQQLGADILKQYQDAVRADQRQNMTNQMINAFGALGEPAHKAPIYYVGAKGDMRAIQLDQPGQVAPLPTNTTTNVDNMLNQIKVQQATTPKPTDVTAQVLQAQALGDMYGVNPLMFLNPDIAKEYMKGRNTLENTSLTGTERRKDIPLNTQSKIIEENIKTAGKLAQDKAQAYYDYILEMAKQQGMDRRQAEYLASQQAQAEFNNQMRAYLQGRELDYKYYALPYNRETQETIANIYANRSQPNQELQDQYKRSQIYQGAYTFPNPQQQQGYWDYVLGTGGSNPSNPYGVTVNQEELLRKARGNR